MEEIVFSHSKLKALSNCPHRYHRRYNLGEPDVAGPPLLIGRAFHKAMEEAMRYKLAHQVDLGDKAVVDIFRDAFDEDASKPTFVDLDSLVEDQIDWQGEDPKEVRKMGERTLLRYHRKHAPFLQPLMVEERIEKEIMPGVKLVGIIDLVTTTGTVIDYKSVNYAWPTDRVEMDLQPTCYGDLLDQPVTFDFHFITRATPKAKSPGISLKRTTRTRADYEWLEQEHIPQMAQFVREANWFRIPSQMCSGCPHRRGCGYRL